MESLDAVFEACREVVTVPNEHTPENDLHATVHQMKLLLNKAELVTDSFKEILVQFERDLSVFDHIGMHAKNMERELQIMSLENRNDILQKIVDNKIDRYSMHEGSGASAHRPTARSIADTYRDISETTVALYKLQKEHDDNREGVSQMRSDAHQQYQAFHDSLVSVLSHESEYK